MRDNTNIAKIALLHPAIREKVQQAIELAESKLDEQTAIRIVQGLRTFAEQDALYNKVPRVTKAKGGQSWHNYGLAVDCAILYDNDGNGTFESLSWDMLKDHNKDGEADWRTMVNAFKEIGFEWGGDWVSFKDNPHFEMRFGMPENCSTALQKHINKQFIPGTDYISV